MQKELKIIIGEGSDKPVRTLTVDVGDFTGNLSGLHLLPDGRLIMSIAPATEAEAHRIVNAVLEALNEFWCAQKPSQ